METSLRYFMAEIESWEAATEFGIPEDMWAGYRVRQRSDDLYIAAISAIFDALREVDGEVKSKDLSELAKTLLIYSKSSASKYLNGVERNLNLLYSASLFYIAGYAATANLVVAEIDISKLVYEEEFFLMGILSKKFINEIPSHEKLEVLMKSGTERDYETVFTWLDQSEKSGLQDNPNLFIASRLALNCVRRFQEYSTWKLLEIHSSGFNRETWLPFIESDATFPLWELFPSQRAAVEKGIMGDANEVFSLQMPTSAGKTSLCEIIIFHEVKVRRKKVLFLVPFRALASEIKDGISKRLEQTGIEVIASYGGNLPTRSETTSVDTADVLIVTPEKFIALNHSIPDLDQSFETIICDEGHLIDDDNRGLQYELLLTRLKGENVGGRKIIFISAILPNVSGIHSWLGGKDENIAISNYSPVETDFAFINKNGDQWKLDFNTIFRRPKRFFLPRFLTDEDFRYTNPETRRRNLCDNRNSFVSLACAAALKASKNGSVALFTTTKGENGVGALVDKLISMMSLKIGLAPNVEQMSDDLTRLQEYCAYQLGRDYKLPNALKFGFGIHHGGFPQDIRREMEEAIHKNIVKVLVCTSTLAEGVNLPIRTLVVHTIKRFDGDRPKAIERRSIKNIVGRVGRAGKETRGRIIFANDREQPYVEKVFKGILLEPAKGAIFKLITILDNFVKRHSLKLDNDLFERQNHEFLKILDKIDAAILDLMPSEFIVEEMDAHIGKIIENTLAYQYFETEELKERAKEVFLIRANALIETCTTEKIKRLKITGTVPRLLNFIDESTILENENWLTLSDVNSTLWLSEIIRPLIDSPNLNITSAHEHIIQSILLWMSGHTYNEIATILSIEIDDCLDIIGTDIGFELQEVVSKATQLAIEKHGDEISELAQNWASMLQFGLGSLQQLDLFELGASDRLAVWGISRYLEKDRIDLRGRDLLNYLKDNSFDLYESLFDDYRVPYISRERIMDELGLR